MDLKISTKYNIQKLGPTHSFQQYTEPSQGLLEISDKASLNTHRHKIKIIFKISSYLTNNWIVPETTQIFGDVAIDIGINNR